MARALDRRSEDRFAHREHRLNGYLTVRETAELLNMHFMSVYKLVQTGELPALKIGSRWKIDPDQLEDWIARRRGVRREWVLLGPSDTIRDTIELSLGADQRLRRLDFDQVTEALEDHPSVVLIDATRDRHAALAALDVCRAQVPPPFTILLVAEPTQDLVTAALAHGVVTLMPSPALPEWIDQVETMVEGN